MNSSLYQAEVKCPVCETSFSTSRVRSRSCIVKDRDTDFCVYYKGCNPILYEAVVCTQCGYAALYERFNDIEPGDAEKVYEEIAPKWIKRDFSGERDIEDAIDAHKLALYCGQLRKNTPADMVASICMRLAWLNRMKGDTEEEQRFMVNALKQYLILYDIGKTPEKMDDITLIYLIGELNRRTGNTTDAVLWFNRVVSHGAARRKPLIVKMAREQWSTIRNIAKEG